MLPLGLGVDLQAILKPAANLSPTGCTFPWYSPPDLMYIFPVAFTCPEYSREHCTRRKIGREGMRTYGCIVSSYQKLVVGGNWTRLWIFQSEDWPKEVAGPAVAEPFVVRCSTCVHALCNTMYYHVPLLQRNLVQAGTNIFLHSFWFLMILCTYMCHHCTSSHSNITSVSSVSLDTYNVQQQ